MPMIEEYALLDPRAEDSVDDALVYVVCDSMREALDYRTTFPDAILARVVSLLESGHRHVDFRVIPWPTKRRRR